VQILLERLFLIWLFLNGSFFFGLFYATVTDGKFIVLGLSGSRLKMLLSFDVSPSSLVDIFGGTCFLHFGYCSQLISAKRRHAFTRINGVTSYERIMFRDNIFRRLDFFCIVLIG
jgi:hypothetical protein